MEERAHTDREEVDERVSSSKAALGAKLAELSHRVDAVKEAVQPAHLIRQPWVQIGLAALAGYLIGSRIPRTGPAIVGPLLREAVMVLGSAAIQQMIRPHLSPGDVS